MINKHIAELFILNSFIFVTRMTHVQCTMYKRGFIRGGRTTGGDMSGPGKMTGGDLSGKLKIMA